MVVDVGKYAVETFSLTKIFADWWGRNKVVAVDELSLKVEYNEVFGLLGPNGSGKTTTLKVLLGLLHATKGKAMVLGGDSRDTKINARIGFLPEESYLYKYLSARETLDFYGRIFGLDSKVRKMRIDTLLEMVGLSAVANRSVGTFSKGMARRIGLAQALINDPEILILDEPTSGLDPIGTRQIKDLIIQLAKRGKTVLLCSHLLADVEDVCDRIAILYGGRLQSQGRVKELLQQTDRHQILTNRLSQSAVEKIKQIAEGENGECEISSPMERLESFFIKTVNAAQRQEQSTSGAVSGMGISEFLSAEGATESILDKLVSVEVSAKPAPAESISTEVVSAAEAAGEDKILQKLTEKIEPAETESIEQTQKTELPQVEPEPVKQDVLEGLVGREVLEDSDEEENTADEGDVKDA